jgi:hypothetical protein
MRISEAKQGEVVCYGNYYFKVLIAATNGIVVENVNTNTVQVLDPETEVTPAEEVIQEVLNQFVDAVNERLSGLVDCDEDEYDEDEEEEEYDEDDAEDELYQECVEDVVEDLKDNGLVEAGEDAEAILLDTEARYHAAIVDAIAKLRMFSYTEDPKLLDDVEETLFTLF